MDITNTDTSLAMMRAAQAESRQAAETAKKAGSAKNMQEIERAAKEFEAVFLSEMMKPMFADIKPDPVFGGGKGEEIFNGMMRQEYGKMMSERGGIGIAEQVKAELLRIQEAAQK